MFIHTVYHLLSFLRPWVVRVLSQQRRKFREEDLEALPCLGTASAKRDPGGV